MSVKHDFSIGDMQILRVTAISVLYRKSSGTTKADLKLRRSNV